MTVTPGDIVTVDPNAPRISASLCVASLELAEASAPETLELALAEAEKALFDLGQAGVEVNEHTLHAFNRGFLLAFAQVSSGYFPLAFALDQKNALKLLSSIGRSTAGAMAREAFGATAEEAEGLLEEYRTRRAAEAQQA